MIDRRSLVAGATLAALLGGTASATLPAGKVAFGMVGKIKARPGQRAALAALMLAGTGGMPGCLSYVVAEDRGEADTLWIFESWIDKAAHAASLRLPAVRALITKARPLIVGFEAGAELNVLGGVAPRR
ncbi:MAG: superfamily monooxygenase protein [Sphingomonas bacterium]|uniref:putative quinol monooxygenase n=1 Tax=Sphingomonas bacterium TaxID=1895847 RepID=UPI00263213AD|nr:putative quinol monooxygenase [Sphingomonas bacterium]MDB5695959.1 superfamily monooxygenase protein [Sphingomonas bacterium]